MGVPFGGKLRATRELTRAEKARVLELLREKHRRHEARRLETERAEIEARCQTLHGFVREFWYVLEPVRPFRSGWALEAMCAHLEAVTSGDIKRLLITVPPGMMKSLLLVFWTAWEWGPKGLAHLQVLATSYSQENVHRDNRKLRQLVESEKFQALWGERVFPGEKWGEGRIELGGGANGLSWARPFGSMTGGRGDRVKIDDPHSTKTAESDVQRLATTTLFREQITDRLNDITESAIVIIMQRLHQQDVAGVALEMGNYVHLNLPMMFEVETTDEHGRKTGGPCRTYVNGELFFEDPRTRVDELLFPERFPLAELLQLKSDKGSYAWAGQYQQRPSPRDGGMFKREWFKPIHALPLGCRRFVRAWDLASTENAGDFTAGAKITRDGGRGPFIFTDVVKGQLSPGGVQALMVSTAATDRSACPNTIIRIPQDPGAAGKAYALAIIREHLVGYPVKKEPPTGSKEHRAMALAVQAEAGNVFYLVTGDALRDAWIVPWLDELCAFPTGAHDDQVDASADAFNQMVLGPKDATTQDLNA